MKDPMTATIVLNDSPLPFYYDINDFFYETINGKDYLVLDRIGKEVIRFPLDDMESFHLCAIHSN